jgi:RHS repeat-associated protein
MQKYDVRNTGEDEVSGVMYYEHAGVWEEYRYDPLGRRILVRTRADGGMCEADAWTCASSITRYVWAGDQLLWELRAPGQSGANLEATSGSGAAYGRVSYTHGGGIDRPLVITKSDTSIVPHMNWRGAFAMGTYADGPNVGRVSDCGSFPAQNCVPIQWPGERTTVYHELSPDRNIQNWFGSLVDDMRDATGQMYRRNRYYDPQTGQFTQPDPIGLAGGLNAYGFAAGDPVTYSDPYGLSPDDCDPPRFGCRVRAVGAFLLGLTPLGDVNDGAAALTGYDVAGGERLETGDRVLSGVGTFVPIVSGRQLRVGADVVQEGVERIGKRFTRAGRREVVEANRAVNGGQTVCANCGVETIPAQQHTRGVTPPGNETHVDHIQARSRGGAGVPVNGQVLCRECNLAKRDQEDE